MRILRIRHLFYPDMPADYFYELSYRQATNGHKVDVITWNKKNRLYNTISPKKNFIIHRIAGLNFSFRDLIREYPYLLNIGMLIQRIKPEIIHGESHLFLPTLQALRAARRLNIPAIVTVHGVFAERGSFVNCIERLYIRTFGRKIFHNADLIICLTTDDAREIMELGASWKKIRLIPNGIDTNKFKPSKYKEDKAVTWVGRYVNEKGVEYLLQSVKLVAHKVKGIHFTLIGYGPLKTKMRLLARQLMIPPESLSFTESLSRQEIAQRLSTSCIFVFPSLKEGMPLALLEAMATGNAVVAFDIPGVNKIIRDKYNGLLVPVKDTVALANAILLLLNDAALREMLSKNARATVENNFSITNALTELDKAYAEAVSYHSF